MSKRRFQPTFLRKWRKHRRYTQEAAAEKLGMDRTNLSKIERGQVPYSQENLEAAAAIYECTPADLLMRDPDDRTYDIIEIIQSLRPADQDQIRDIIATFKRKPAA